MKTRTRKTTRVLCASAIAMMTLLSSAAPAFAVNNGEQATTTSVASNKTFTFNKFLKLKNDAKVPPTQFNFTVASNDTDAGKEVNGYTVFEGVGTPTISEANFTSAQTTYDSKQANDDINLTEGYKYAKSGVTVNFDDVTFARPGIYRYTITEKAGSKYFTSDTSTKYLDVYVYNNGNINYIMHKGNDLFTTADEAKKDTKITSITNTYNTQNLSVTKNVTGNQAVNDDFFKFTVNITDLAPGAVIDATGLNKTKNAVKSWTASDEGRVTAEIFLSANSGTTTFTGLTSGAKYTVKEEKGTYTPAATVDGTEATLTDDSSLGDARAITDDADNVVFTNTKNGTIPTGIYLNHKLPFNIAGIAILGGAISLVVKKRHDALEEDDDE